MELLPMRGETPDVQTTGAELQGGLPGVSPSGVVDAVGTVGNIATGGKYSSGINAATGITQGKPATNVATDFATDILGTFGKSLLNDVLGDLSPMAGPAIAGVKESFKDNPNYGKAVTSSGIQTGATMLGGLIAGVPGAIVGGLLSGYAAKESFEDGILGDMVDSRTKYGKDVEGMLDYGEDKGWSDKEKDDAATEMSREQTRSESMQGRLGQYASKADTSDLGGENDSAGDVNGKGEGSGHGDRDKGEGGLGGY
jgi:hypothetical protein